MSSAYAPIRRTESMIFTISTASATSWTRMMLAPLRMASVLAVTVPMSRFSTGRSRISPMKPLRERPTRMGKCQRLQGRQLPDDAQVVLDALAEADARIDDDHLRGDARRRWPPRWTAAARAGSR